MQLNVRRNSARRNGANWTPNNLTGDVKTIRFLGWEGTRNGTLLDRAAGLFDVLVTFDKGFDHEQNVAEHDIGVVLIVSTRKGLSFLIEHVEALQAALEMVLPGEVLTVRIE